VSEATATGYASLLDDLEGWLGRASALFPALARDEARIREQAAQLRTRGTRLESPLVVLITGGTGAGKSTLLNALAGEEIAQASAVRPTTTALTCYVHEANELMVPAELGAARRVLHERAALRDKLVIDTPDFDSTSRENEAALRRALVSADVVLVLATPEKYANKALFELLVEHRAGRAFVFAMNRADRGIEPEVRADFTRVLEAAGFEEPRLLAVSALAAYQRKRTSSEPGPQEGEFAALEAILERELDKARIREIKRQNLDALVLRLVDRAARPLPQDLEERVKRWRRAGERTVDEVTASVAGRLAERVRDDDALAHEVAASLALRHDGLIGFWQALVWGVRGLRGQGLMSLARRRAVLDPALLGAGIAAASTGAQATSDAPGAATGAVDADEERALGSAVSLATRRIADQGREHGLSVAAIPVDAAQGARLCADARHDADRAIDAMLHALRFGTSAGARRRSAGPGFSAAAEARTAILGDTSGLGLRLASLVLNAGPLAVLAYALYRWFEAFLRGEVLGGSWFMAAGIVCVILLALEGKAVDWLARRRAAALVRRLEEAAAAAADQRVARPLKERLERALAEVASAAATLDALRDAAHGEAAAEPQEAPDAIAGRSSLSRESGSGERIAALVVER